MYVIEYQPRVEDPVVVAEFDQRKKQKHSNGSNKLKRTRYNTWVTKEK